MAPQQGGLEQSGGDRAHPDPAVGQIGAAGRVIPATPRLRGRVGDLTDLSPRRPRSKRSSRWRRALRRRLGSFVVHRRSGPVASVLNIPIRLIRTTVSKGEQLMRADASRPSSQPSRPRRSQRPSGGRRSSFESARHGGAHLVLAGHVAMQREGGVGAELAGEGVGLLVVHVRDGDLRAASTSRRTVTSPSGARRPTRTLGAG